jgi:hypothetical protein
MSAFWKVATREFASRKMVLWTGVAIALLALAAPLFPWDRGHNPADVRALVTVFFGVALAAGSALLVGASLVGTDLSERRIAFYFSRPISPAALWWGKVAGGFAVVLLSASVSMLPNLLPGKSPLLTAWGTEFAANAAKIVLVLFFLFVLAAALSVAFRSHSVWLAVDAAILVVTGALLWFTFRRLAFFGAGGSAVAGLWIVAGALFAGLLAGGWVLLASGRTELVRAHRALSFTVWSVVLSAVFGFAGWALWAVSYGPGDMQSASVRAPSGGQVAVLQGHVRGRGEDFSAGGLLQPASGRFFRLPSESSWSVACSRDGRVAVWNEAEGSLRDGTTTVVSLDLTRTSARPVATRIVFPRTVSPQLALSPDGRLLAATAGSADIAVYEVATGRITASVRLEPAGGRRLFFETPTHLVILSQSRDHKGPSTIQAFDIVERHLGPPVTVAARFAEGGFLRFSPEGDRILCRQKAGGGLFLLDRRTGSLLATLAPETPTGNPSARARFLSDGRIVAARLSPGGDLLDVHSKDGSIERTIALGARYGTMLGGEIAEGKIALSLQRTEGSDWRQRRIVLVDISAGTITELTEPLAVPASSYFTPLDGATQPLPGSLATRLFHDQKNELQLFDPSTGKATPFLPGRR